MQDPERRAVKNSTMKKRLQNWVKALVTIIVAVAVIDFWRDWPWAKRMGALFSKKDEGAS
jgi:hypothetical protein